MVRKDPTRVQVRFALAFPDVYEIAQSHAGLQILYDLLNHRPDVYAERVYAPWLDMEAELCRARLPLASLETFTPLSEFDIVGFTLQYELTYTNLLGMLNLGGVPLQAADRHERDPLVIAGGPCAFNPEPLVDFLDAIVLGDGEQIIHEICDTFLAWDRHQRTDLLAALAGIRGIYVPAFFEPADGKRAMVRPLRAGYERVEKRIVADLNAVPVQNTYIVPTLQVVHDRPSLEVMRGCVKGCRFCQAGYVYRPLRERDPRRVLEQAQSAIRQTGHDEISLLSLSTGDYSCVNPLLTDLMNRLASSKVAVSLPSTRVDALAPSLLEQIKRVRKTGFTLAPEAGSQRMRDIIHKGYREDELIAAAEQIFSLGWRSLKLYFMLGLPSETEDDLMGIVDLSAKVAAAGHFRAQVTASVSNFVPKPHTPFQWAAQVSIAEMGARQRFLRHELGRRRIRFRWHDARLSYLEGIFSRGDRQLGGVLRRAFQLGCRFDGWNDVCRFDLWQRALDDTGVSGERYLQRRVLDEPLPWDHLSSGVTKMFLQRELARAFERTPTPDCSIERCTSCGACDFISVSNVDYHLLGARGAVHRGDVIAHWASEIVPESSAAGAWEPRGWRKAQAKKHGQGEPAPRPLTPASAGASEPSVSHATHGDQARRGLGNAEEWLTAVGETLAPAADVAATVQARLRLRYTKLGPARFIGSLELTTLFYRAARRAGLPLAFSQGHHPLPRFAFGPALALGAESDCEFLDIDLVERANPGAVQQALNAELPEGISITDARIVPLRTPSLVSRIAAFQYRIDMDAVLNGCATAHIHDRIAAFNRSASFPLAKHAKGGDRVVDARQFVVSLRLVGPTTADATILHGTSGSVKPTDLLAAILGLDGEGPPALRVRKVATVLHTDALQPSAMPPAAL